MKALILTYYWPPAGGSGVQRWLKFAKYLRDYGIEPVIYTVDDPNYAIVDKTLQKDIPQNIQVLKQPIWEPYQLASVFSNKNTKKTSAGFLEKKTSLAGKIITYIRANYFIPDARKFWIKPSVKYLSKFLSENKVDVVITTGPPHSVHLIGLKLKEKLNVKWISDFRDPWTDIDYYHQLPLTKRAGKKHRKLEKKVLKNSDAVLVVGDTMKQNYTEHSDDIHVITNGFDQDVLENTLELDSKFSITHIGMMNTDRNPGVFWKVLSDLVAENKVFAKDLHIKLIGEVSEIVLQDIQKYRLEPYFELIDYLPHHKVLKHQQKSQVLLLALNNVPSAKGIITGKIFEYLMAKRPIMAIGPTDGDLSKILERTKSGVIIDFNDENSMRSIILELYAKYKKDKLVADSVNIEQYHRKQLTKKLADVIKRIIE